MDDFDHTDNFHMLAMRVRRLTMHMVTIVTMIRLLAKEAGYKADGFRDRWRQQKHDRRKRYIFHLLPPRLLFFFPAI